MNSFHAQHNLKFLSHLIHGRDLEPFIGSRARVAEVLNHRRSLTLPMIRKLHSGLGIPAEVLIRDSDLRTAG